MIKLMEDILKEGSKQLTTSCLNIWKIICNELKAGGGKFLSLLKIFNNLLINNYRKRLGKKFIQVENFFLWQSELNQLKYIQVTINVLINCNQIIYIINKNSIIFKDENKTNKIRINAKLLIILLL